MSQEDSRHYKWEKIRFILKFRLKETLLSYKHSPKLILSVLPRITILIKQKIKDKLRKTFLKNIKDIITSKLRRKLIKITISTIPHLIQDTLTSNLELLTVPIVGDLPILSDHDVEFLKNDYIARDMSYLVSIIMPTWNRRDIIGNAINSVVSQRYANWELIIIDDGSADNTEEVINLFSSDERIKYIKSEHAGASSARNTGLELARGEVIAYLDSDNEWHPDYLLLSLNHMIDSGKSTHYCAWLDYNLDTQEGLVRLQDYNRETLLINNYIDLNVFIHMRELIDELGTFNETLKRWIDWDLILRYAHSYPPSILGAILCYYYRRRMFKSITDNESQTNKYKVRNNNLIDWEGALQKSREPGLVSIIIPLFNGVKYTKHCVQSIIEHTRYQNYEIILMDNGSSDGTDSYIKKMAESHPKIRTVRNPVNYGFAIGCNRGADIARGEYLLFINNDTEVTDEWLTVLMNTITHDQDIGAVGPKLVYPDTMEIQHAGMVFSNKSKIAHHIYKFHPEGAPEVNKERQFQVLTGACMLIRSGLFFSLGGFPAQYLNGGEDIALCFKIRQKGKRLVYQPASTVYHMESRTEGRFTHNMANRILFVNEWGNQVIADNEIFFKEDGFVVTGYDKLGNFKDDDLNYYRPIIIHKKNIEALVKKPKKRLLILRSQGIGNGVLATPFIRYCRELYPDCEIHIVCERRALEYWRSLSFPGLHIHCHDCLITWQRIPFSDILIIPRFVGVRWKLYCEKAQYIFGQFGWEVSETMHETEWLFEAANALIEDRDWKHEIPFPIPLKAKEPKNKRMLPQKRGISIFNGCWPDFQQRQVPFENFADIVFSLATWAKENDRVLFLLGSQQEKMTNKAVIETLPSSLAEVVVDISKTDPSIQQTVFWIESSDMVISTDSSIGHLTAAQGVPLLLLVGPTSMTKNIPIGPGRIEILTHGNCQYRPCYVKSPHIMAECPTSERRVNCMRFESHEILEKVHHYL